MPGYYFTFRSLTSAQRASKVLDQAGIRNTLLRTPKILSHYGCGYSLRVYYDAVRAKQVLSQNRIMWKRVYLQMPDGRWEEDVNAIL